MTMTVDRTLMRRRLAAAIEAAEDEWLNRPIVWGEHDCGLAAANLLKGVLGRDPAARYRNRYRTPLGYRRVLRRDGHADLAAAVAHIARSLGWREIAPADAEPGDLGLAPHPAGASCVLCKGGLWVGPGEGGYGVGVVPSALIIRAWSVLT